MKCGGSGFDYGKYRTVGRPPAYKFHQLLFGASKMRKILSKHYIKSDKNTRVLDLCCGTCDIIPYLEFKEYVGVDLNKKYILHNKAKFASITNASFYCADVNAFIEENNTKFNVVLLLLAMHHIDDASLKTLLKNIFRALPTHGRLVTIDGCRESNITLFEKYLFDNDRGKFIRTKEEYIEIFLSIFKDYQYTISRDLYHIPYNSIIFNR